MEVSESVPGSLSALTLPSSPPHAMRKESIPSKSRSGDLMLMACT